MPPDHPLPPKLRELLVRVRRRRRTQALVVGLCAASGSCAAFVLLMLVTASAGAPADGSWLAVSGLFAVLLIVGSFLIPVVPVWLRTGDLFRLARAVDDRWPLSEDGFHVAVALAQGAVDAGRFGQSRASLETNSEKIGLLHQAFVEAHLARANTLAEGVELPVLLPWSRIGRRPWLGPLTLVIAMVMLVSSPSRQSEVYRWLKTAWAEGLVAPSIDNNAEAGLEIRNLRLRLEPPQYTGRDGVQFDGTSGDFQAMPGTKVYWTGELAGRFSTARLLWPSGVAVPGEIMGPEVSVEFLTNQETSYRIQASGLTKKALSRAFRIEVLPDKPPGLEVRAEAGPLDLAPGAFVRLELSAWDDFGLSDLRWVLIKGGRELAQETVQGFQPAVGWDGVLQWSPSMLPKPAGGDMELVIEAVDNDTVSGPKTTRSRPLAIYVPTSRDHHRKVLALKEQLLNQGLDFLASLYRATIAGPADLGKSTLVTSYEAQRAEALSFFASAQNLQEAMRRDRLERRDHFEGIGQLVDNLARRWQTYEEAFESEIRRSSRSVIPRYRFDRWAQHRRPVAQETERVVLDLSAFSDLHRGGQAQRSLAEMEPSLADLASLLRRAAQGEDLRGALSDALAELQERFMELQSDLAGRSRGPQDSFVNRSPSDLSPMQGADLAALIQQGRYEEALERVQESLDALAALETELEDDAAAMAGGQDADLLGEQLEAALEEARSLEATQQRLIADSEALRDRIGSDDSEEGQEGKAVQEELEELERRLAELPEDGLSVRSRADVDQRMRRINRQMSDLREAWNAGLMEQASDGLQGVADELQSMARASFRALASDGQEQRSQENLGRRANEGSEHAQELAHRIDRAAQRALERRARFAEAATSLEERQRVAAAAAARLKQRIESIGGGAYNPVQARDGAAQAAELMQKAAQSLQQGRGNQAIATEGDALSQVKICRRSLEGALQGMKSKGQMGEGGGMAAQTGPWSRAESFRGDDRDQEVEMPDPEDFIGPEAWRAVLQEGASEETPERYRSISKRYYEELVR